LRQVGGFIFRVLRFPSANKTDCHDITEILLQVALNTIPLTLIFIRIHESNTSPEWELDLRSVDYGITVSPPNSS
jgi:hypothetical protein